MPDFEMIVTVVDYFLLSVKSVAETLDPIMQNFSGFLIFGHGH
jgi:hypothetical protein